MNQQTKQNKTQYFYTGKATDLCMDVAVKQIGTFAVDTIANTQPVMKNKDFELFVSDIQSNGLCLSILTRNGKIIDGRHRALACQILGIKPTVDEKGNIADEEAYSTIYSCQLRKNDTDTQKQIKAYDMWIQTKKTREEIQEITGVSKDMLTYCKNIFDEHPEYKIPLLNDKGIAIRDLRDDVEKTYINITPLAKVLKANKSAPMKIIDLEDTQEKYNGTDVTQLLFNKEDIETFWYRAKDTNSFSMYSLEMYEYINYLNCKFLEKRPVVFLELPQNNFEPHLGSEDWQYINSLIETNDLLRANKKELMIKMVAQKKVYPSP